jgi:hypothetical protein
MAVVPRTGPFFQQRHDDPIMNFCAGSAATKRFLFAQLYALVSFGTSKLTRWFSTLFPSLFDLGHQA